MRSLSCLAEQQRAARGDRAPFPHRKSHHQAAAATRTRSHRTARPAPVVCASHSLGDDCGGNVRGTVPLWNARLGPLSPSRVARVVPRCRAVALLAWCRVACRGLLQLLELGWCDCPPGKSPTAPLLVGGLV